MDLYTLLVTHAYRVKCISEKKSETSKSLLSGASWISIRAALVKLKFKKKLPGGNPRKIGWCKFSLTSIKRPPSGL